MPSIGAISTSDITDDVMYSNCAILQGQSLSAAIDLKAQRLGHINTPGSMDGTVFTFAGSYDGSTYLPIYDEGTEYNIACGAGRSIAPKFDILYRYRFLKIRTGTAAAPVTQSGAITLVLGTFPR